MGKLILVGVALVIAAVAVAMEERTGEFWPRQLATVGKVVLGFAVGYMAWGPQ